MDHPSQRSLPQSFQGLRVSIDHRAGFALSPPRTNESVVTSVRLAPLAGSFAHRIDCLGSSRSQVRDEPSALNAPHVKPRTRTGEEPRARATRPRYTGPA